METQNTIKRVKSGLKGFENAYKSLPYSDIHFVRKQLMERLGWSMSIFGYKKRGDTPIWEHEADVLHEVFSRYGILIIN